MANEELRNAIKKKRLRHYEIADFMGISECTLCKWLRAPLPPDKEKRIHEAIEQIEI